MLSEKQLKEIREHLEGAQNPVFFFDNDCDGLISFVLIKRFLGRGKGVAIKSFPELDSSYIKRVDELNADCIFVLDKPFISEEFIKEAELRKIKVICIDHHDVEMKIDSEYFYYYNPLISENPSSEPTSYLCYLVSKRKKDDWICLIGCIGDCFVPDFFKDVYSKYPELLIKDFLSPFEIYYNSDFGKLVDIVDFSLKDRTSNVVNFIKFFSKINSPYEILKEDNKNLSFLKHYGVVKKTYDKFMQKAKNVARYSEDIVFFKYGGSLSMSSNIANELSFRFPSKVIIVAYLKGNVANLSIRGNSKDIRGLTLKAVSMIEGAIGGGHKYATGAKIPADNLDFFYEIFKKNLK